MAVARGEGIGRRVDRVKETVRGRAMFGSTREKSTTSAATDIRDGGEEKEGVRA
jgi:hypothetical protein